MAGVAEDNGLEFESLVDGQHGYIVVVGAFQHGAFGSELRDLGFAIFAAIDAEAANTNTVLDRCGLEIFEGLTGDAHNLVFQSRGVFLDALDALGIQWIDIVQTSPQNRSGMRV